MAAEGPVVKYPFCFFQSSLAVCPQANPFPVKCGKLARGRIQGGGGQQQRVGSLRGEYGSYRKGEPRPAVGAVLPTPLLRPSTYSGTESQHGFHRREGILR